MTIQASDLTLYHFATCPFCMRVRHALHKLGLTVTMKNTRKSAEAKRELLEGGGRTMVPCLRIENEDGEPTWMYESGDIVAFLHEHFRK